MATWPKQSLTEEEVEDIVGMMVGYGLEYDDAAGILRRTREGPNPYDIAETFAESDVTVSHSGTETALESILLALSGGSTAIRPGDNTSTSNSNRNGLKVNPNVDTVAGFDVLISGNVTGATRVQVYDTVAGEVIGETTGSFSGGDTVSVRCESALSSGTDYHVVVDAEGSNFTQGYYDSASFPYTSSDVDIVNGASNLSGTNSHAWNIEEVRAMLDTRTSGTAHVEWPDDRKDVYEWDVATFQVTEDGATVDLYVQYDDGSGWQYANGGNPINRHHSLADDADVSPSDNVRLEAQFSRPDATYNPALNMASVSWVV